jgi:PAS domain S-box-containing protein
MHFFDGHASGVKGCPTYRRQLSGQMAQRAAMKNDTANLIDHVAHFSEDFTDSEIDDFLNLLCELVCVIDENGRFLRLNVAAQQALGIRAADIFRFNFYSIVDVDFLPMVRERLQEALDNPDPIRFTTAVRTTPDRALWIEWTVVRSRNQSSLLAAGRDVSEKIRLSGQQKNRDQAQIRLSTLSCREHEVLSLVVAGNANKVIARRLDLSEKTIERHRSHGMKKLGICTVPDLVRLMMTASDDGLQSRPSASCS